MAERKMFVYKKLSQEDPFLLQLQNFSCTILIETRRIFQIRLHFSSDCSLEILRFRYESDFLGQLLRKTIMVHVNKKEGETSAALLRRFQRRVQLSGVLLNARKHRFYTSKATKRVVRERALRRIAKTREHARLEKLGKLPKKE